MKLAVLVGLTVCPVLIACGAATPSPAAAAHDDAPAAAAPAAATAAPAAAAPESPAAGVTGVFKGKPFASKSAIAKKHDQLEGEFKLYVVDDTVDCGSLSGMDITGLREGARFLAANVDWKPGAKTELQDFNGSFGFAGAAGSTGRIPTSGGTIEIVDAPTTPGQQAKVRIDATSGAGSLKGETPVTICP